MHHQKSQISLLTLHINAWLVKMLKTIQNHNTMQAATTTENSLSSFCQINLSMAMIQKVVPKLLRESEAAHKQETLNNSEAIHSRCFQTRLTIRNRISISSHQSLSSTLRRKELEIRSTGSKKMKLIRIL